MFVKDVKAVTFKMSVFSLLHCSFNSASMPELWQFFFLFSVGAVLVAAWCKPSERLLDGVVSSALDDLAADVKERLHGENPSHPACCTSLTTAELIGGFIFEQHRVLILKPLVGNVSKIPDRKLKVLKNAGMIGQS